MSRKIKVKGKTITIYNDFDGENKELPIIFYNTFSGDGESVWKKALEIGCKNYIFVVIGDINWEDEMTPWKEPPIFRTDKKGYEGLADKHLEYIENVCLKEVINKIKCKPKSFILSGYSLGGLFSMYSMFKSKVFTKYISASGSLWFPKFIDFINNNEFINKPEKVYLSLGDKEKYTKEISNCVEDNTNILFNYLKDRNIDTKYELNEGNHFKNVDLRIAKAIKWILE